MKTSASINGILKRELEQLFGQQDANIETAAQCLKVMFHPARLRILCALREGEQTVQNLEYYTGIKQSTLSLHLALLKSRVVLVSRRETTYSFYRLYKDQIIQLFDLPKPKRIDSTDPQDLQCGFSLELGHVNEDNFTMHDFYQLLDNLKSTERVIDVRPPNEYSQGHVPGSLNIPMGNEQSFLEELSSYQKIFEHCHSGRRAQTVYSMLGMQGLENGVCINSSGMADWTIADFPVER